jgi:hypothetical protein
MRRRWLRLGAPLAAMFLASSQATASPSANLPRPSTPAPTTDCTAYVPAPPVPAGTDITALSDSDLAKYNLPPRPPADSRAYSMWLDAMQHATIYDASALPVCPAPGGSIFSVNDTYSGNWAGYYIKAGDAGGHLINIASSEFTVPGVSANPGFDPSNCAAVQSYPPNVSPWVGIGGTDLDVGLIQAGTTSCATSTARYRMWNEDAPAQGPRFEGPAVSPGDTAYDYVQWNGNNTCYYFEENITTGLYHPYTHTDCVDRGSHTADYIMERAGDHYLPSFADFRQWDDLLIDDQGNDYYLDTVGTTYDSIMTSNCHSDGIVLSNSGSISSTDDGFAHSHVNDSPECN